MKKQHWCTMIALALCVALLLLEMPSDIKWVVVISIPIVIYWGTRKED